MNVFGYSCMLLLPMDASKNIVLFFLKIFLFTQYLHIEIMIWKLIEKNVDNGNI